MTRAVLLSCDPATRSGWARWDDGVLREYGTVAIVDIGEGPAIREMARIVIDAAKGTAVADRLMVTEAHGHRNSNALRSLAESRVRWTTLAHEYLYCVESVAPQTWQATFGLGKLGKGEVADRVREAIYQRHVDRACERGGLPTTRDKDALDVILIGLWWLGRPRA